MHTETHFLAWVPTGRASSGTGEAKWSGSPFEAQSLTAANLHHLEQQGKKQPMYIKTWHPSKGTTSVRFTHRDEQRPALGAGRATFHRAACSPALAGEGNFPTIPSICATISHPLPSHSKLPSSSSPWVRLCCSNPTPAHTHLLLPHFLFAGEQIMCW